MNEEFKFTLPGSSEIASIEPVNTSSCQTIQKVSLEEARSIISSSLKPVFVKFFAPWCGACQEAHQAVQEASCSHIDDAEFISVDVDAAEQLATEHGIDSLPTVAVFRGGQQGERREGSGSARDFNKFFKKALED